MNATRNPKDELPSKSELDAELLAENLRLQRAAIKHEVKISSLNNKIAALKDEIEETKKSAMQVALGEIMQRAGPIKSK